MPARDMIIQWVKYSGNSSDLGIERQRDEEIDRFFLATLIKTSTHLSYFWIRNRNSVAFGLLIG